LRLLHRRAELDAGARAREGGRGAEDGGGGGAEEWRRVERERKER
jgi:hypothetical protein